MRNLAAVLLLISASCANAQPLDFPGECTALLGREVPEWKTHVPIPRVVEWAKSKQLNPIVTSGDFDGNKAADWAMIGSVNGKSKIALCLAKPPEVVIVILDDGGCSDLIETFERKTEVWNYDTDQIEVLRADAVATSCFQKSGRVFVYENGVARVFLHSD